MQGDESYAGASSWLRMEVVIKDLTTYPYVLPTHQGRAAEHLLYNQIGGKADRRDKRPIRVIAHYQT